MTAANGGESGATGSFGAVVARGEQAGAKVNFGGELEFDHGSTWHLESTEQAKEFRAQLDDYLFDQWSLTHPMCSPMGGMCWPRPLKGTDPPPVPSTPFGGIAPTADVTADPGISATTRTSPLSQAETPSAPRRARRSSVRIRSALPAATVAVGGLLLAAAASSADPSWL